MKREKGVKEKGSRRVVIYFPVFDMTQPPLLRRDAAAGDWRKVYLVLIVLEWEEDFYVSHFGSLVYASDLRW